MFRLSDKNKPIVNQDGLLDEQNWLLFKRLESVANSGIILDRYSDLAALNAKFVAPVDGMKVIVSGQGEAHYKASVSAWVKSADDSTVIV